jgi:tetratricopeptide (TPR) repeat protein
MLAMCEQVLGDPERALAIAEEGLDGARQADDAVAMSYSLQNAGVVLAAQGRLDEAGHMVKESLELARELGNIRSIGNWSRSLAGIAMAQGDGNRARPLLEESLAVHRRLGDRWGISHSLSSLALLAQEQGDGRSARRFLTESFEIEREVDDRPGLVTNLTVAARVAAAEQCYERATRLYAFATVFHERGQPRVMEYAQGHPTDLGWRDSAPQLSELRAVLGDAVFAEVWARGEALTLDAAVSLALEEHLEVECTR